jgi:ABC-type lipoprotein export system ATPase subunit
VSADALELRDVFCVHRSAHGDAAALQGLSLKLRHGERVCILGPSGAGKTTLLRVVAGLQEPSAGAVLVFGTDIGRERRRRRAQIRHHLIGFLDQRADASLPPDLTVAGAIGLPLALRGVRRRQRAARVRELLGAADLADRADALPSQLSGGERQRAALCAALAPRPALLLADEPTAELDEASARRMASVIDQMAEAEGTSVLLVSHDPAMGEGTRRVLRMRDGRIVEERRDRDASLVVGADGWVRLPRPLLDRSGIGLRARAVVARSGVLLTPATPPPLAADSLHVKRADPPASPPAPIPTPVQLERVWRWRGHGARRRLVIADLTAAFQPGCLTVVSGRSGSGKTTLLELLACMGAPDAGELRIAGEPLAVAGAERLAEVRRRRIGYLPQEPAPVGFLSAAENIVLGLRVRGVASEEAVIRAEAALEQVGLGDRRRQRVSRLSAGEAQRVALARALACGRGLLVVDEPTSRLDASAAAGVAVLLADAARDGQTVICATHDPLVTERADQVLALGESPVITHGSLSHAPLSAMLSPSTNAEEPA